MNDYGAAPLGLYLKYKDLKTINLSHAVRDPLIRAEGRQFF